MSATHKGSTSSSVTPFDTIAGSAFSIRRSNYPLSAITFIIIRNGGDAQKASSASAATRGTTWKGMRYKFTPASKGWAGCG
jgi:hypothetical protein